MRNTHGGMAALHGRRRPDAARVRMCARRCWQALVSWLVALALATTGVPCAAMAEAPGTETEVAGALLAPSGDEQGGAASASGEGDEDASSCDGTAANEGDEGDGCPESTGEADAPDSGAEASGDQPAEAPAPPPADRDEDNNTDDEGHADSAAQVTDPSAPEDAPEPADSGEGGASDAADDSQVGEDPVQQGPPADPGNDAAGTAEDSDATGATSASDGSGHANTDGESEGDQHDAFVNRLIVRLEPGVRTRAGDEVLGVAEDAAGRVTLLGYGDARAMEDAIGYYEACADWVAVDTMLHAARAGSGDEVAYSEDDNPIDVLGDMPLSQASEGVLVALLDTGVPAGEDATDAVSVVGDDVSDNNGHATAMAAALREQNPRARVRYIKVLDDHGRGTASSVYAGVVSAVEGGCSIVNLSLAGSDVDGNAAIREAVDYALAHGVIVVAAAGNGGQDAAGVTPANIAGVLTVGAADGGNVLATSNRGSCVDLYVEACSTSEAAAKVAGWLSAHLSADWREELMSSDLNALADVAQTSDVDERPAASGRPGVHTAATGRIYWKLSAGVLHISASKLDDSYSGPVSTFESEVQNSPWHELRRSITRAVVDTPLAPLSCVRWFYDCTNLTSVDLSKLDMSGVINTANMFYNCTSLKSLDVSGWDLGRNESFFQMFYNCRALTSLDVSRWNTSSARDLRSLFDMCVGLTSMDISRWNTANVTTMKNLFKDCTGLVSCNVSGLDTSNVKDMTYLFHDCSALTSLDVSGWDVSNVESMHFMFKGCTALQSLDISAWDVGNVRDMENMFNDCVSLAALDVSRWDTSSVQSLNNTFNGCRAVTYLDVSRWDTSSVTNMHGTFANCLLLNGLDVSGFDTANVEDMSSLFGGCTSLDSVDLGRWDTSRVMTFDRMFVNCKSLKQLDLSSFNTSSAIVMSSMFRGCTGLKELDLAHFRTDSVTTMAQMFDGCRALTSLNIHGFDTSDASDMGRMFASCNKLCSVALGPDFSFTGARIADQAAQAILPTPPSAKPYTGRWANSSVEGYPSATPEELRARYDGSPDGGAFSPGTFVWERLVTYHFDPNCDDAEGTADDALAGLGAAVRMPKDVFTRALFDHVTWNTSPDGTGSFHAPGSTLTNEVDPYGEVTDVTLYAIWEAKQMSVRVPAAIHYVADQRGVVRGPDDDVARIRNTGQTDVALDGIRAEAYEPWHFVAEGGEPAEGEMSLGMRLGDSERLDFSSLDGSDKRFARLEPSGTLGLRELGGATASAMQWDEWELGCLHWFFRAVA